jgi:RHS repeat-associated protein
VGTDCKSALSGIDGLTDPVNDYSYDNQGNMTSDQNKGITSITYNHLNQPLKIIFNNNTNTRIEYFYTSSGEKVQKKVFTAASAVTTTDYLDGFQYTQTNTGMVILQFFPHAEGYVNNTVVSGANVYSYVFNYTDHLGNIRLRFTRNTNGTLRTLEQNHYYPYGMKHEKYNEDEFVFIPDPNGGYNSGVTTGRATGRQAYQYKYNGKEWQDELGLNMTAMDMRMFDNAIARWVVLDPVVHHGQTPYNGFDGNPVYWADPSGADGTNYSGEGFRGSTYDYQGRPKYNDGGFYIPAHERGMANSHYDEKGMYEDFGEKGNYTGPGVLFDSAVEAAIDFGLNYNGFSIINGLEVYSLIYKLESGEYSYLTPFVGAGGFISETIATEMMIQLSKINGAVLEADIHSHGSDPVAIKDAVRRGIMKSDANKFSGEYEKYNPNFDGDIHMYRNDGGKSFFGKPLKGYMTAPNGGLYYFDPSIPYGKKGRDGNVHYEFKIPIYKNLPSDYWQGKQRLNQIEPTIKTDLKFQNY